MGTQSHSIPFDESETEWRIGYVLAYALNLKIVLVSIIIEISCNGILFIFSEDKCNK